MTAACLVVAPYSFSGAGPAQSCASILANFPRELQTHAVIGRAATPLDARVAVRPAFGGATNRVPWRLLKRFVDERVRRRYVDALDTLDARTTVAYFWPGTPVELVDLAKSRGFLTVREMINTACATAGPILNGAYESVGLPPTHSVDECMIATECAELTRYDYVFASNPRVEQSLADVGIPVGRILPTSFGWDPKRFPPEPTVERSARPLRMLFVGSVGVRKGALHLVDAWRQSGLEGELLLAGPVDMHARQALLDRARGLNVRLVGRVTDVGALYAHSDVFVFPTFEEGGPQVTYEAAGCGLPIITTDMGAGRLVEDDVSGIVVRAGDVGALSEAMRRLASDPTMRDRYGAAAKAAAVRFRYDVVGRSRGFQLLSVLHQPSGS